MADIAASMLYNCDPQVIEDGFEKMLEAYYKVFQETCKSLKIDPPFSFENLKVLIESTTYVLVILWCMYNCMKNGSKSS